MGAMSTEQSSSASAASSSATKAPSRKSNSLREKPEMQAMDAWMKAVIDNPMDEVNLLRKHAKELRDKKIHLAKDLKNAQRRTRRMQRRAKNLTDEELLSVLCMRTSKRDAEGKCKVPPEEPNKALKQTEENAVAETDPLEDSMGVSNNVTEEKSGADRDATP